jgi:hypothetical protein
MTLYTGNAAQGANPNVGTHRRRDPDPIEELATIDGKSQDNDPDRPHLSVGRGPLPGFGPDGTGRPIFSGDPTLGIDPRVAAAGLDNQDE